MEVVILAAGKGTRMNSDLPKVLHEIGGHAMLAHVINAASQLQPDKIHVVVGFGAEAIKEYFHDLGLDDLNWVLQSEQLGTGHAVQQALPDIDSDDRDNQVLILYGDVPLIQSSTLQSLCEEASGDTLALLTVDTDSPEGLGRIIRNDSDSVQAIVEHRDATAEQRQITEVNTGIMAVPATRLAQWLNRIGNDNDQGEYYLTDVVELAVADGCTVSAIPAEDEIEVTGVNDKQQLALLEREYQFDLCASLMSEGVTMMDPQRVDIRGELSCGRDVVIDCNVVFEGQVSLGDRVRIGANCIIRQASIGDGAVILPGTQIEEADIGEETTLGPMARIRPGTVLKKGVKVGNFVEIKKSVLGEGSKANHLSYIGDAEIGSGCNIGAGTIFCNYDGANKHKTVLGNNVFIGSNSTLVAPVELADDAFVAAGSVINKQVPEANLAIARGRQSNIEGWQRPRKGES